MFGFSQTSDTASAWDIGRYETGILMDHTLLWCRSCNLPLVREQLELLIVTLGRTL